MGGTPYTENMTEAKVIEKKSKQTPKPIMEFVRNDKKQPVGVLVALDRDHIGFSFLNTNSTDKWSKEFGIRKAVTRAHNIEGDIIDHVKRRYRHLSMDHKMRILLHVRRMQDRARKYYHE